MFIIVAAPWGPNHLQFRAHRALLVTDNPDDSDETTSPTSGDLSNKHTLTLHHDTNKKELTSTGA